MLKNTATFLLSEMVFVVKLCVEWGSTNTSRHIDIHYVKIFTHTQSVNLKYNGLQGYRDGAFRWMGHLDGWGIYGLNGSGSYMAK